MTWKNEKEKLALVTKLEDPGRVVLCPSCHHELSYEVRGNSEIAICETCGSFAGNRGI